MSAFWPNAARAASIDCGVRIRTAESLAVVAQGLATQIPERLAGIGKLISALRSGPVRPAVFALYSDLVLAIQKREEESVLSILAAADSLEPTAHDRLRPVTVNDNCLGPNMAYRYMSHADDDPIVPLSLVPLRSSELAQAASTLTTALQLIGKADSELAAEITNLVREIVFAYSGEGAPGFGGSTTFYLWGAVFLNLMEYPDQLSMAEGLVHEAAHTYLLGSTMGEPLVENDQTERFASPLREDPRPMDGIVHACFVLARMHYLMRSLLRNTSSADRNLRGRMASLVERYRREFSVGDEVVGMHARFTCAGEALYRPAREYMLSC
jgi:hypothetical protein